MKKPIYFYLLAFFLAAGSLAHAGTKEELVRLQNDVINLQKQFRAFEKTFDERTEGLKSLVVQLNDQTAQSNVLLAKMALAKSALPEKYMREVTEKKSHLLQFNFVSSYLSGEIILSNKSL